LAGVGAPALQPRRGVATPPYTGSTVSYSGVIGWGIGWNMEAFGGRWNARPTFRADRGKAKDETAAGGIVCLRAVGDEVELPRYSV